MHIQDADAKRAGRAFSQAAVELALASYPGCTLTTAPGDASPYGVFGTVLIGQGEVDHVAVLPDGTRVPIAPPAVDRGPRRPPDAAASAGTFRRRADPAGSTGDGRRGPLRRQGRRRQPRRVGPHRRGLRPGCATTWTWRELKRLLPECAPLAVVRYELPNLRAVNFVLPGLLGQGVAASTRFDPQAKALGEWLRSRHVRFPEWIR